MTYDADGCCPDDKTDWSEKLAPLSQSMHVRTLVVQAAAQPCPARIHEFAAVRRINTQVSASAPTFKAAEHTKAAP